MGGSAAGCNGGLCGSRRAAAPLAPHPEFRRYDSSLSMRHTGPSRLLHQEGGSKGSRGAAVSGATGRRNAGGGQRGEAGEKIWQAGSGTVPAVQHAPAIGWL
jgi:hypothetical protein